MSANSFPKYLGSLNDTNALKAYGKQIDLWLKNNPQNRAMAIANEGNLKQINTEFFKSLTTEEKAKFKEAAFLLSFVLKGQKDKLIEDFNKNKQSKEKNFVDEAEQVYVIHEKVVNDLIKMIKG